MREIALLKKLPPIFRECGVFKAIDGAEKVQLTALWTAIDAARNNQYIQTLDAYGTKRWEKLLGIFPKATDSIEDRRFAILSKVNERVPFTYIFLQNQMILLCGKNGYTLSLDNHHYCLKVRVELWRKAMIETIAGLLSRVVPANMVIDLDLLYNQHLDLAQFTHGYLHTRTYKFLREEVLT